MTAEEFASVASSLDPAMAIVTVAAAGERSGCLVGFHGQSSIDPLRYVVWLSKANHTYGLAITATHLGVHFLTADDRDLATWFGTTTGDAVDKFHRVDVEPGLGGVPLLSACPHRMVVRRTRIVDADGDHVGFVGEPVEVGASGPFTPLRLSTVDDLSPGHPADDRPRD